MFLLVQGDTLRGVARELDCVLKTGHYEFVFTSAAERTKGTLELIYRPMIVAYVEEGGAAEVVTQRWNKEQINDFVRKLGFLDSEGAAGDKINHFLHLHQVCILSSRVTDVCVCAVWCLHFLFFCRLLINCWICTRGCGNWATRLTCSAF